MQIQRTGYQQNFGTQVVATIKSPQVMSKLAILERRLAKMESPEVVCMTSPPNKVIFVDGEDLDVIAAGRDQGQLSTKQDLEDLVIGLEASSSAHEAEIDGDSLDELLAKVPMLQKFSFVQNILRGLFNLNSV